MSVADLAQAITSQEAGRLVKVPGIGKKTALRLVLALLKRKPEDVERFAAALTDMHANTKLCKTCNNLSDEEVCSICASPYRDETLVCVVADIRDVMAIENTGLYRGQYHVLGGLISPIEGISPSALNIESLVNKLQSGKIQEIILALNATMEGETTSFYIFRKIAPFHVKLSAIARGLAVGDELEYADEVTLGRSILNRIPFDTLLRK